jgi:DNA invertase Pin-like site-specific DNA recombinase
VHLFLGTQKDNVQDMIAKGRYRNGSTHGEKNPRAKLTEVQVREIGNRYASGETQRGLAGAFEIDRTTVARIVSARSWACLGLPAVRKRART